MEYIHNGEKKSVRAQREVILSAGAIGSPQILMLSGVGHKNHLEDLGVRSVLPQSRSQFSCYLALLSATLTSPVASWDSTALGRASRWHSAELALL